MTYRACPPSGEPCANRTPAGAGGGDFDARSDDFVKDGEDPPGVSTGILSLFRGEHQVGEDRIKTQPGSFGLSGTDLTVGRSITRITDEPFTGGTIKVVAVDVSGEPYIDLEHAAAAMIERE